MIATRPKLNIYEQYTYSYPHKHTYRPLAQKIPLEKVWEKEAKDNLFAYLHIPFCEMRCGFCNLFTIANPKEGVGQYLDALQREALTYKAVVAPTNFEEYAIGGGTPTFLSATELARMLAIFKEDLGVNTQLKYGSIEASPKSITAEKIQLIEAYGINRISMGVQSWITAETKLLGRPQTPEIVHKAVDLIKNSHVPEFNLDLIYGIYGQTKTSWLYSLERTVAYEPTEIFLYPLYTRPLTGLSKMQQSSTDNRLELYRVGIHFLKENDYIQTSMRCFRKANAPVISNNYSATTNGMIGIGAGARSYTSNLHYSTNYAVTRKATKAIIHAYSLKENFETIDYGFRLNKSEQINRFLIKSLIDGGILYPEVFQQQFGIDCFSLPIIQQLRKNKWLKQTENYLQLSKAGMELEDAIGPMFYSKRVKDLTKSFELA